MSRRDLKWLWWVPAVLFAGAVVDRQVARSSGWDGAAGEAGEAARLAPDPAATPEAVIQVYAARVMRWRGYFGVHTWIAVKPEGAARYTVYEINGWRLRRARSTALVVSDRAPDTRWFGMAPTLLAERRGPEVAQMIERVERAVQTYPYATSYRAYPGPNSNTFVAHVLRAVPELRADLPPTAIGKDYLGTAFFARTPSGTGVQVNVFGLLGVLAGVEEGLELNLLGLTFGIDPLQVAVKLPLVGSVGWHTGCDTRANGCIL